jgi:DNA polymerase-3 subunit gamma/tau
VAETPEQLDTGYQSLYRRFRPQRFDEVLGQDHVALALRNAVRDGQIGHAYLFSGPRGTGKTSTARILGKALNCTDPSDGEPCGICASCTSVAAGTSFDVHELDAASNGRVEDIRDLISRAALATPGRWKVYILDEVHMLSTAASNALLRTLEEPPDHVVFVLATTDPQKVLPTIRSRTQHFEFHLLSDEVLAGLLGDVATSAALDLPDGALVQAVRRGRGSARDALSILDQVAASGIADVDADDWLTAVITALDSYDQSGVLLAVESAVRGGRDSQQLALDFIDRLRVGFLSLVSNGALDSGLEIHDDELVALRSLGVSKIVRAMELIGGAVVAMRDAPDPRITLEVAFLRLSRPEDESSFESVMERLERLEHRIDQAGAADSRPVPPPPGPAPTRSAAQSTAPVAPRPPSLESSGTLDPKERPSLGSFMRNERVAPPEPPIQEPVDEPAIAATVVPSAPDNGGSALPTLDAVAAAWTTTVLVGLRPKVRAIFQAGRMSGIEEGTIVMTVPNDAHMLHAEPLRREVEAALSEHFSRPVVVRLSSESAGRDQAGRATPERVRPSAQNDANPTSNSAPEVAVDGSDDDFADITTPLDRDERVEPAPSGVDWAKAKVLEAFPGAEEV